MGLLDFFASKKKKPTRKKNRVVSQSAARFDPDPVEEIDPVEETISKDLLENYTPFAHNDALFERFYHDLRNHTIPDMPEPTPVMIREYTQRRKKRLSQNSILGPGKMNLLLENDSIPVTVEIWVDQVFDYYLKHLIPMRGQVHQCEQAMKALYIYKGYIWHTFKETHPTVMLD